MCAEFRPVVRGWRSSGTKTIWSASESIKKMLQCLGRVLLDAGGLVQNNRDKALSVKLVQPVVVRDVDLVANFRLIMHMLDCHAYR